MKKIVFFMVLVLGIISNSHGACSSEYEKAYINEFNTQSDQLEIYLKGTAPLGNYDVKVCNSGGCATQTYNNDGSTAWIVKNFSKIDNNNQFDLTLYGTDGNVADYIVVGGSGQTPFNNDYQGCPSIDISNPNHRIVRTNNGQRQFYRDPDGGSLWVETQHNNDKSYGSTNDASQESLYIDDDKVQCPTAKYTTIQGAINDASAGAEIIICDGTYNEAVNVNKNNLTLRSQSGIRDNVVIQNSSNNTVSINSGKTTIKDLSITSQNSHHTIYSKTPIDNGIELDNVLINSNNNGIFINNTINSGGITVKNTKITAQNEAIAINNTNGLIQIESTDINAKTGVIVSGTVNTGFTIDDTNITASGTNSSENGIYFRQTVNNRLEITNTKINSNRYGIYFGEPINTDVIIDGLTVEKSLKNAVHINSTLNKFDMKNSSLKSSEAGIYFHSSINSGIVIDTIDIEATTGIMTNASVSNGITISNADINSSGTEERENAIFISQSINGGLTLSDINITSNRYGIYTRAIDGGINVNNVKIKSDSGSFFGLGTINGDIDIDNSSFESTTDDAVKLNSSNINSQNSCYIAKSSGKYALYINVSGTGSTFSNNCFYADSSEYLARAPSSGNNFTNNYWDGVSGNYEQNNISDTSPQLSCQNSCALPPTPPPSPELTLCHPDDFDRTSLGAKWFIIKQEGYTPQIVNNRLRLTDNANNRATGVNLVGEFPSSNNYIEIEFDHYAYGGGNGADGITAVFSDANVTPIAGAYGGSLGYAQRTGRDGFAGGWLGFGFDEYGNYSNGNEGRQGGIGFTKDAFAIRGAGSKNTQEQWRNGYQYLGGTPRVFQVGNTWYSLNPGIDAGTSQTTTPLPGYKYKLKVDTRNNQTIVGVERDINDGNGYQVIVGDINATQSAESPDNFKFSLVGSTGGSRNIHEIDNLKISAHYCGTLGGDPESTSVHFDTWEREEEFNTRGIYTKVAGNYNVNLPIYGLSEDGINYQDFNGTVCSTVVNSDDNTSLNGWTKLLFASEPAKDYIFTPNFVAKNARIGFKWEADVDTDCINITDSNSTVSSDNFSIRPINFRFDTITMPIMRAGAPQELIRKNSIKALNVGNQPAKDYNTTDVKMDLNITIQNSQYCENNTTSELIDGAYNNISLEFADGNLTDDFNITFNDVGELSLDINVTDSSWTKVDSDKNQCVANSTSNNPNSDPDNRNRVGCNIGIEQALNQIKIYPHHFDINTSKAISHPIGGSDSYLYYGQGRDDNLSENYIELDINITAKSESNATTLNYDGECFAPDNTDLNISLEFEEKPSSEYLTMRYLFDDSQNTSGGSLSLNDKKFTIENIVDENTTYNDGLSENELKFIFDVNQVAIKADNNNTKKPINPMKISTSQNKITLDINATMSDDVNVEGSLDNADSTMQLDNNITYYFGRLTPIDAQTTDDNVGVTFYIDVYCDSNCSSYDLNSKSVKYPANWYINTNENNLEIDSSYIIVDSNAISVKNPITFSPSKNGETTANFRKVDGFYGKAKVDIDLKDSDQTFIYYNPYSDTNITRFYIDFLKKHNESIGVDDVIDNQGKDSDSGRRLRW